MGINCRITDTQTHTYILSFKKITKFSIFHTFRLFLLYVLVLRILKLHTKAPKTHLLRDQTPPNWQLLEELQEYTIKGDPWA